MKTLSTHPATAGILSMTIILSCWACKVASKNEPSSELDHAFGNVRTLRTTPLQPCTNGVPVAPIATSYLRRLMDDMMSRVNGSGQPVFVGHLSPDRFCVTAKIDDQINANANPSTGAIILSSAILRDAKNDASIAAILAHELAHVTLNHDDKFPEHSFNQMPLASQQQAASLRNEIKVKTEDFQKTFSDLDIQLDYAKLEGNVEYATISEIESFDEFVVKYQTLVNKLDACKVPCPTLASKFVRLKETHHLAQSLEKKLYTLLKQFYSAEDLANRDEVLADEVGLEFFARAGWKVDQYLAFRMLMLKAGEKRSPRDCLSSKKSEENRGLGGHPATCWWLLNSIEEIVTHDSDYKQFQRNSRINLGGSPTLAQVQAELTKLTAHELDTQVLEDESK